MAEPVILLTGDDELLLQRSLEDVLAGVREAGEDLDVEVLDVSELDQLPEMRTQSLFGGRTCVVLRGAESISGSLKGEVEAYLEDPDDAVTLVLVAEGTGRIRRIARLARELGREVETSLPRDWDDAGWRRLVVDELERADRRADREAVEALREHAGNDAAAIASKVGQVVAATDADATIGAEDVEEVVAGHGRVSGFAIADAVADRDPAATLVALRGALESGVAPLAVLGSVSYRFRQLVHVRGGVRPGGMSGAQYRRLKGVAADFNAGEIAWCVDLLASTDVALKSSDLPAELLLEVALLRAATPREPGSRWNPRAAEV